MIGQGRYTASVRKALLAMSPSTIDRYLQPARAKDAISGRSTTKPGTLLRSAIKTGRDVEGATLQVESIGRRREVGKNERSPGQKHALTWAFTSG
ncbi:hypothetical protein [Brevibacterium luteolum]|uniref:hypothetical protein n=1 Tax=Brevibacterium luteolum TaxID=199591 RepID=UPI00223AB960|nr:hypothetical protein [Brevibacterium luteolum]MCT1829914.1 hypothetical protein [Brevibacterium luteolum]